jgi:hypothetical protein
VLREVFFGAVSVEPVAVEEAPSSVAGIEDTDKVEDNEDGLVVEGTDKADDDDEDTGKGVVDDDEDGTNDEDSDYAPAGDGSDGDGIIIIICTLILINIKNYC